MKSILDLPAALFGHPGPSLLHYYCSIRPRKVSLELHWFDTMLIYIIPAETDSLVLGFWTANTIKGFSQGKYMALYAGIGKDGCPLMATWIPG